MRDLGRAMQAVTDAWALGAAMPALDEFTYLRARCRACLSCILVLLSETCCSVINLIILKARAMRLSSRRSQDPPVGPPPLYNLQD